MRTSQSVYRRVLLVAVVALGIGAPVAAQPTEEQYHLAALDYAVQEQAGNAAQHRYPLDALRRDGEIVGRCENGLRARSSSMYVTSWQHHPDYWRGRLARYRQWIALHNSRNPNQQLAAASGDHLDPLTGARVTIWWMLNEHGGTWRGTSGWPYCGRRASR